MKKYLPFSNYIKEIKKIGYLLLFLLSTSVVFGQTITPVKTVTVKPGSCGVIDVQLDITGANPINRPLEVVLVIDVSGSMNSPSPTSSLTYAKIAANKFIDEVLINNNPTHKNKVAIVTFSTNATIDKPLTDETGIAGLKSFVTALTANGSTNLQDAIAKADAELSPLPLYGGTGHGTYDCATARSIVLLTDGVTNRTRPTGSTISCTTVSDGSACVTEAIAAAAAAKTTTANTPSPTVYTTQFFSICLTGGISGTTTTGDLHTAHYTLDAIQSGGYPAYYTTTASDLTAIYADISTKLSWIAKNLTITETVIPGYTIALPTPPANPTKGITSTSGQVITWNVDFLNVENITLNYTLTPTGTVNCNEQTVSTSTLNYTNTSCLPGSLPITTPPVTVPCPTAAAAGSDQAQCNSGSFTLAANAASVGTGTWTVVSGTATITDIHLATSAVTGVPAGSTTVLKWKVVNGTCSTEDNVSLTNDAAPTAAAAGSDQAQCNSGSFTLAANAASAGTGTWTVVSGTATITDIHLATSAVTGVPAGSTTVLKWKIVNGTCSTEDNVSLTVNQSPNAPSGINIVECKKPSIQTLSATATVLDGQSIVWYDAATNGNIIAPENLTLSTVGTVTYYAQAVNNTTSCISLTRTPVVLTINDCSIAIVKTNDITVGENGCATLAVGDVVTYTFTVTNPGNVSIHNVAVEDLHTDLSAIAMQSGDINDNSILEVNETWIYTATYAVKQSDIDTGKITNQASVSGTAPDNSPVGPVKSGNTSSDNNPNVIPICTSAQIALVKTNDITVGENGCATLAVDDVVTYTFTVTNPGNVSLHNVAVEDLHTDLSAIAMQSGDINDNSILEVNETWIYTATYTVKQSDIDTGKITNQASVSGTAPDDSPVGPIKSGNTSSDNDPNVIPICTTAQIALVKTNDITVGENGCTTLAVDDVVTYTFTVTNLGNVSLHNVTVEDLHTDLSAIAMQSGDINNNSILEVNETWIYTATYIVKQSDIDTGKITNQASVSGTAPDDSPVGPVKSGNTSSDNDPNVIPICTTAQIALVKTGVFMDENNDNYAQVDETITYTFTVKNTGNVTLKNIDITDITNPSISLTFSNNPIATLVPGDSKSITGTYKITQSDIDAGMVTNSALATGKDPKENDITDISGTSVENNTPTVTPLTQKPELTVTKTATVSSNGIITNVYSFVGDLINYTIIVKNTGNMTLKDIVVTDELTKLGTVFPAFIIPKLLPGEFKEFNQTYTITKDDLTKDSVINEAKAIGKDQNGNEIPPATGTVIVEKASVLGCESIVVHNAFTPNGDGINELFIIDGIDDTICYPENTIEIYNRWGVLVFETRNYNNQSNVFDGYSRGRTTISQSSGLPTGTYYYILNYTSVDLNGNIQTNKKDGYLYLSR